jgi:CheY-like chemotaxis protein
VTPSANSHGVEAGASRPLSILVADDEAPLRWSISAILQSAGHRVVEADDGQVALGLLQEQDFDVLVLDLHMPNADGMAILRQVQVPPLIVIVYSAFAYFLVDAVRDAVGAKVFRYMQKPVPPLELIAAVNEAAAELGR